MQESCIFQDLDLLNSSTEKDHVLTERVLALILINF